LGYTGLLSVAHAAFFGIGAYCSAILAVRYNIPFIVSLLASACIAAFFGLLIGLPTLRFLRGDYFALATLGFGEITRIVMVNWRSLTGGPDGIPGIQRPIILGLEFNDLPRLALLTLFFLVAITFIVSKIVTSPFGRILKAIKQDEDTVQFLGRSSFYYKVIVLTVSAFLAGIAGNLYAYYFGYINPSSFSIFEAILIICMVIVGGMGSIMGSLIGATLLVLLPESFRFLGLPSSVAFNLRQLIYGITLIILVIKQPKGIAILIQEGYKRTIKARAREMQ